MKRAILTVLCVAMMIASAPRIAEASMIGDLITVTRLYPDLGTIFTDPPDAIPGVVTVIAQAGPDPGASPQPNHYSIDFQPNNIVFDFGTVSAFLSGVGPIYNLDNPFDGLKFEGFSLALLGASVASVSGISVTELFIQDNALFVSLNGEFDSSAALNLQVDFARPAAVPEPATLVLLGVGLSGLAAARKRKANKVPLK